MKTKTFNVTLTTTYDVQVSHTREIEAGTEGEAIDKAKDLMDAGEFGLPDLPDLDPEVFTVLDYDRTYEYYEAEEVTECPS